MVSKGQMMSPTTGLMPNAGSSAGKGTDEDSEKWTHAAVEKKGTSAWIRT